MSFILHILLMSSPSLVRVFIVSLVVISAFVLVSLLVDTANIKVFLAYTSGLHTAYVLAAVLIDRLPMGAAVMYVVVYAITLLTFFTAALNFKNVTLSYLTDMQVYTHAPTQIFWPSAALASMAGVPPLMGF
jgi:NADH:ubiquinone oxidoreductase subunit 2 (subunit N)